MMVYKWSMSDAQFVETTDTIAISEYLPESTQSTGKLQ